VARREYVRTPGRWLTAAGAAGLISYFLGPVIGTQPKYAVQGWVALFLLGVVICVIADMRSLPRRARVGECRRCRALAPP
jgi:hypothetical protein